MGLGALVVVGVLFAAGFYLPRRLKIHAGEGKAAFPAKPDAGGQLNLQPTPPPAASPMATPSTAPASSEGGAAAHADAAGNSKRSSSGSQGTPANADQRQAAAERAQAEAEAAAAAEAQAQAAAADLKEAEAQEDQLNARTASVSQSLDNLKSQQSAQGYGLRGDVVSAEQRMQSYMSKAQAAFRAGGAGDFFSRKISRTLRKIVGHLSF
jgi:hypothetical protein